MLVDEISKIDQSYRSARQVLCARLFEPERRILYAGARTLDSGQYGEFLTSEEKHELAARVEEIDPEGVQSCGGPHLPAE